MTDCCGQLPDCWQHYFNALFIIMSEYNTFLFSTTHVGMASSHVVRSNHLHGHEDLRIVQYVPKTRHAAKAEAWEPCRTTVRLINL